MIEQNTKKNISNLRENDFGSSNLYYGRHNYSKITPEQIKFYSKLEIDIYISPCFENLEFSFCIILKSTCFNR